MSDHDNRLRERARGLDRKALVVAAIAWLRETERLRKAKDDPLTWDDLSDAERDLQRAIERYERRLIDRVTGPAIFHARALPD